LGLQLLPAAQPSGVRIVATPLPSAPVMMGQAARIAVSWQYTPPSGNGALVAWPFVNGSQWGASLTLADKAGTNSTGGSATILLPLPHAGLATVQLVALRGPLLGVTVGVLLSSQSSADRVAESNTLRIPVLPRTIARLGAGGGAPGLAPGAAPVRVGLQWEPILASQGAGVGGGGAGWAVGAEALPLVGRYSAYDPNVLKQHAIWLAESGIEWVNVDWTNNLWGKAAFEPDPSCWKEVINATSFAVAGWRRLEAEEGIPCPKIALMMGLVRLLHLLFCSHRTRQHCDASVLLFTRASCRETSVFCVGRTTGSMLQ